MLSDCLLKIDGIDGESNQAGHEKWIELQGWEWFQENDGSAAIGSGGGTGKVKMGEFRFQIETGISSPKLFIACATGQHIPSATLHVRKAGGRQETYIEWKFRDLVITRYRATMDMSAAAVLQERYGDQRPAQADRRDNGVMPVEEVAFNFACIETQYRPQKHDGSLGPAEKAGFDQKKGKRI